MNKLLLIAPLLALVLSGCPSTPIKEAPVEDRKSDVTTVKVGDATVTGLPLELTDSKSVLSKRIIYFDLDKYDIKDEYKELVAAHAKFLVANRPFKMLIQGHTDERGSREYNLSLGQKRAEAVKRNLILLGAKEEQVEAVSFGKEKPAAEGHNEAAWAQNRRAHMLYKSPAGSGEF
ncbi:MAG: Peptidoglycan-associated lipoprotein precursor [Betaproteobacteria bacterium ADurb.Bin341]|nr:MAG: Peptidoglycan-associated lipoprotein precursor [Betaproteobacteria bacterium ADurb.Bin341]